MTRSASRTAVLVCQGRAVADGRLAVGRFADPVAASFLWPDEHISVDLARAGMPPSGARERVEFERLRATADVMAARTVAIDDAVRAHAAPQLVVLGAGLDDRAWRMTELAGVDVYEVDAHASQADKRARVGELEPVAGSLTYVTADLVVDDVASALATAGHVSGLPTTWVWEGVVPYLTLTQVDATMRAIARASAPGSTLVVNYQSRRWRARIGRLLARAMALVARADDPMAGEPFRSSWTTGSMAALLGRHGFAVESDRDLETIATAMGAHLGSRHSLRSGRVAIARTGQPS